MFRTHHLAMLAETYEKAGPVDLGRDGGRSVSYGEYNWMAFLRGRAVSDQR